MALSFYSPAPLRPNDCAEFFKLLFKPLKYGSAVDCEGEAGAGCAVSLFESGGYAVGLVTAQVA